MMQYSAELSLPDRQFSLFTDYVDQMLGIADFADLIAHSRIFFEKIGVNAVNFGIFRSADNELVGLSTNMRQSWIDRYWERDYVAQDPLVAYFSAGTAPAISGWRHNGPAVACDDAGRQVLDEAAESGYPQMMFQPVRMSGQEYSGSVTLFTDMNDYEADRYLGAYGGLLTLAATCAGQRAAELFLPAQDDFGPGWWQYTPSEISPREIEVLKWLASGFRPDQIAFKLGVRPVTVHMHITSARRKLGASTREQLMCLAVLRGYV